MLDDELGLEAMSNTAWFCDEVCLYVGRIMVVGLGQFQVICQSVKKTDRNDAGALVFFLSKGVCCQRRV